MIRFSRPTPRLTELRLLVIPALLSAIGLLTVLLVPKETIAWTWRDLYISFAFIATLLLVNLGLSVAGLRGDQVLLPTTATLAALGLIMVNRLQPVLAARSSEYDDLAKNQLIYLVAGFLILLITMVIGHFRLNWLRRYKYTPFLASLGLMIVTFFFGVEVNGARLWLLLGPIRIQPSEIVKITLTVFLAGYLADKQELIGSQWRIGRISLPPIPYLLPMGLMWVASLMILVVQNDLGSALLFFGIFLVMLYVASNRLNYVVIGLFAFAIGCVIAYQLFDRIGIRVQNWIDPWQDPLVRGYQPIQSEYAIAAGGFLGTGLGKGSPWLIPYVQTDFVFSAMAEELGLLGGIAILALYFILVMRGFMIGLMARDSFSRLLAIGLSTIIGLQTIIILGGVLRLIPLTGITLPFISSGGSSLLTNFLLVGLLLVISAQPGNELR